MTSIPHFGAPMQARPSPAYLDALNDPQRQAVETIEGPLLVLAGAGTGKTRVLTFRLAHILQQQKAWPSQILAVTFTNKAAAEMRRRVIEIIGEQGEQMSWLGTFHRIGVRILRRHGEALGLRSDFTILDQNDQVSLLKRMAQSRNIDIKRWEPRQLAAILDSWKNRGLTPDEIPEVDARAYGGKGVSMYREYQDRLRTLNAVDFGDLLLDPLRLFLTKPDILAEYQDRFRYILVDEYQDTNVVQYLWLRLLARKHRNLCCVGDDDQSIYSWRGAQVGNILNFEKDFPEAGIIRLEQNYRSTHHILKAASCLISANGNRLGKSLWTPSEEGEKVSVRGAADSDEEAMGVARDIQTFADGGKRLDDIAILVRVTMQMLALEEALQRLAIPYRVIGGLRFFERAEIRDINAYLRLIAQSDDDVAFERVVNRPRRGLGDGAMEKLRELASAKRISLFQAAEIMIREDSGLRARKNLQAFLSLLEGWKQHRKEMAPALLARRVVSESGYREMWEQDKSAQAPGRLENLDELLRFIEDFASLEEYLEHVALVMDADQQAASNKVQLMTLHSAKGLEFDTVFLPGWEEGLFPHQRALEEEGREGLEEERRLAYVGITRARRKACISFCVRRFLYGQWQNALPSRFLEELPKDSLDLGEEFGGTRQRQIKTRAISSDTKDNSPGFRVGERVFHRKFGYGRISQVEGERLSIDFEHAGEKKVIASFVDPADESATARA